MPDDKRVDEIAHAIFSMIDSLHQSMIRAHCGIIPSVTWMRATSVAELIALLATNDVRFTYVGLSENGLRPESEVVITPPSEDLWNPLITSSPLPVVPMNETGAIVADVTGEPW